MTFLGSKLCSSFRHAQIDSPIDWDDVSFPNSITLNFKAVDMKIAFTLLGTLERENGWLLC
jgi:hypothetical protein